MLHRDFSAWWLSLAPTEHPFLWVRLCPITLHCPWKAQVHSVCPFGETVSSIGQVAWIKIPRITRTVILWLVLPSWPLHTTLTQNLAQTQHSWLVTLQGYQTSGPFIAKELGSRTFHETKHEHKEVANIQGLMKHFHFYPFGQVWCGLMGPFVLVPKTTSVLKNGAQKGGITHCSIDDPQKCWAEWKNSDTRDHILYNSICMKCPKKGKFREKGSRLVVARG